MLEDLPPFKTPNQAWSQVTSQKLMQLIKMESRLIILIISMILLSTWKYVYLKGRESCTVKLSVCASIAMARWLEHRIRILSSILWCMKLNLKMVRLRLILRIQLLKVCGNRLIMIVIIIFCCIWSWIISLAGMQSMKVSFMIVMAIAGCTKQQEVYNFLLLFVLVLIQTFC